MSVVGFAVFLGKGPTDTFREIAWNADNNVFIRLQHPNSLGDGVLVINDMLYNF